MRDAADEVVWEARALDVETALRLGARREAGKFIFDYRKDGRLSFRKLRDGAKNFWIEPSGAKLHLWGLDSIQGLPSRPVEPLVITEGEFDRIAVIQACGGYAVSVPNGANGRITTEQIKISEDRAFSYLWGANLKQIPELAQFSKVILFTDADEKGFILRDELALRIGDTRCWWVEPPADCKDANDVLRLHGAQALRETLAHARPMRPGYLVRPADLPPRDVSVSYSTGWVALDVHMRLVRPELVVITGIPGHGKSQWMRALTFRLARAHGWTTAYLCPEDPPLRLRRDMERFAERRIHKIEDIGPERRQAAKDWVNKYFWISSPPDDEIITLGVVIREMESAVLHHGAHVFVIDPWNEISHERGRETDTLYIESTLQVLKQKARQLGLLLIIVAHPRKVDDAVTPCLYDISGSANWKNKADHGVIIWRDDSDDTHVILEKCKDQETMGIPGTTVMVFKSWLADFATSDENMRR